MRLTGEVERPDPLPREGEPVGVDLGLSSFLVLSDGTRVAAPKPLARKLRGLRRRSKQLARKQKGSRNYAKASLRLARWHRRIRNLRRDFLHQVLTGLAKTQPVLVVEALNGRGRVRGRLSRSIADVGWGMFLRFLAYKAQWYGAQLLVAPPDFPVHPVWLGVWRGGAEGVPVGAGVSVCGVRAGDRPGSERRAEPTRLWVGRPERPYREFRGK